MKVRGKVSDEDKGGPLPGVQVLIVYQPSQPVIELEGEPAFLKAVSAAGLTDADGAFDIEVDLPEIETELVTVSVLARAGERLTSRDVSVASLKRALSIRTKAPAINEVGASDVPELGARARLTGVVVHPEGRPIAPGLPVVISGVPHEAGPGAAPIVLVTTATQVGGHFGAEWPSLKLERAAGRVAGSDPSVVPLDAEERLVKHVILVANVAAVSEDGACDCDTDAPRAPDQADLIRNPTAFSQDLGGQCLDLTTPNRAIEEFTYSFVVRTSQPRVRAMTLPANNVPRELVIDLLGVSFTALALGGRQVAARDLDHASLNLDVDTALQLVSSDTPPKPEAIAKAAWLSELSQTKTAIGQHLPRSPTRGPLNADSAIDWDDTPTIHQSTELAFGHVLRYRETWRADGYSLGDLLYSLPLAPLQRRRIAVVDWDRQTASTRAEALEFEESLDALLSRDRDVQEIVGSNLHEATAGGSSNTTWGVAGGIGAGFIGKGFGIFGGVAGGSGGSSTNAWQRSSRKFSAESLQKLRDRVGQRASSLRSQRSSTVQAVAQGETVRAESEVVANYNRCHAITIQYFEVLRHFLITHELADVSECVFVPLPVTLFNRGKALRWRTTLRRYLKDRRLARGFAAIQRIADEWEGWNFPENRYSEEEPNTFIGELRISFVLPRPRDGEDGEFQRDEWLPYAQWLFASLPSVFDRILDQISDAVQNQQAARDRIFTREVAPEIAENLVNALRFSLVTEDGGETDIGLDATLVSDYREGRPLYVTLRPTDVEATIPREDIAYFKIDYQGDPLPADARVIVHSGKLRYSTEYLTHLLFDEPRIINDIGLGDSVLISTPLSRRELRNPREEDLEHADALVAHLNEHIEYYHQAIWFELDAQRRFMLLDAIRVPGTDGRSVASVCTNELIGIVGNSLVLPVAPGQKLDPSIDTVVDGDDSEALELKNLYATPPAPSLRISIPTRGVYAEAIQGQCNACELIDDNRYWRWSTEGLLSPPEIAGPISTASRQADEPDLTPTALPGPLVNIQTAPDAPDPFGLSEAFKLLAEPELFRDITGLEGTIKNAGAAFEGALAAASAIGGEATKLAKQQELSKNADRMIDRIQQAVKDDLLTEKQGKALTESVLEGLTGKADEAEEAPTKDRDVEEVIDAASKAGTATIKASSAGHTFEATFSGGKGTVGAARVVANFEPSGKYAESKIKASVPSGATATDVDDHLPAQTLNTVAALEGEIGAAKVSLFDRPSHFLKVVGSSYTIRRRLRIFYPADPADTSKVESGGPLPVAVFLHGNHGVVKPAAPFPPVWSHEGYHYLQDDLAQRGIVSVSIDNNMANAVGSMVHMRALMVIEALEQLADMNKAGSGSRLEGRLDLSKVMLVGHSRGGEAVVRAAVVNRLNGSPFGIMAVCAIGPTDFIGNPGNVSSAGHTDLTSADTQMLLVIHGALDGDVGGWGGARAFTGHGFRLYDRATCPKALLNPDDMNHNRFNSVWMADTGDENDAAWITPRLRRTADVEAWAKEHVGALADLQLLGKASAGNILRNTAQAMLANPDVAGAWAFGSKALVLDDLQNPAAARSLDRAAVGAITGVNVTGGAGTLEAATNHDTNVLVIESNLPLARKAAIEVALAGAKRDWSRFRSLTFRAAAEIDPVTAAVIAAAKAPDYAVTLTDGQGRSLVVQSSTHVSANQLRGPVFHAGRASRDVPIIARSKKASPGLLELGVALPAGALKDGDHVFISGHVGSTPDINGLHPVTVVSPTEFTIPVSITTGGTGGNIALTENLSAIRLGTVTLALNNDPGIDWGDIRKLEIVPGAGYPTQMLIDSIVLWDF